MNVVSVSAKGQVVLPSDVRENLSIAEGDRLAVFINDGMILLKPVKAADREEEFSNWLEECRTWASSVGLREEDIRNAVQDVRRRKRHENRN